MTTEEKIEHFYKISLDSAKEEAAALLSAYRAELEAQMEEHRKTKRRLAEDELKTEKVNVRREVNKALSSEQVRQKRILSKHQNELKTQLFALVEEKLEKFRRSEEYPDYLLQRCEKALEFAGEDEILIFLSPSDAALAPDLEARLHHPVEIGGEEFGGGIRAEVASRNVLIDDSFASMLETERADFTFEGGISHE